MTLCTTKCQLDETHQKCISCGRTVKEIQEWRDYDLATRAKIKKRIKKETKNG